MSRPMDRQRRNRLTVVAGIATLAVLVAGVATWQDARRAWAPAVEGPVLPDWTQAVADARRIEIDSAGDTFALERTEAGWVMPSRDHHPVRPERLAELDAFLAGLRYDGARTADPDKHARLGLAAGGEGAATRVTLSDGDGHVLSDILLGRQSGATTYIRFPGRDRAFAARSGEGEAALPAIALATDWLDLEFLDLGQNGIARAVIRPETGPTYVLERPGASVRNFVLRDPSGWRPITAAAGNGPASALSRVRFRDVRAADRLGGTQVARHQADTFSGLRVEATILALGDTRWALLRATALSDGARETAAAFNAQTEGWAYLLSDLTLERLIRPLDRIADPRPVEPDDAP